MRITVVGIVLLACASARADLIGYWNFNNQDFTQNGGFSDIALTTDVDAASTAWFAGSTLNAMNGDPAEEAFCAVGNTQNGRSLQIAFNSNDVLLSNINVSYATRGTSTGFSANSWWYSTDGVNFTKLAGSDYDQRDTTFAVRSFDFTPLANVGSFQLRLVFDGASSTTGNNRIDNLQVNASVAPVPEPATMLGLALGLAGAAKLRRRRR